MDKVKKPVVDVTGANLHYSEGVQSLSYYLKDVRKYDIISIEQEQELFRRIRQGDKNAINELVSANQRFVLAVAKRFSIGDNIMDLVQVGNMGMLQAIEKFDPDKKCSDGTPIRFLSFASWYIRREISFYLLNNGLVKKTNNVKTTFKINKVKNNFFLKNGRYPNVEELSEIMDKEYGIKIKDLSYLYDVDTKYLNNSYNEEARKETFENSALFNEKSASQNDYISKAEKEDEKRYVGELLDMLKPRERTILERLYGINTDRQYTMDEIAKDMNLTRERVRQIKTTSVNKLKKLSKSIAV